jgi:hypothetical protein
MSPFRLFLTVRLTILTCLSRLASLVMSGFQPIHFVPAREFRATYSEETSDNRDGVGTYIKYFYT